MSGCFVLPGDPIDVKTKGNRKAICGSGIYDDGCFDSEPYAVRCGILKQQIIDNESEGFWIDFHTKRYIPVSDDYIIGIIAGRTAEFFSIDINAKDTANLPNLGFEGATNRNRPNLNIGDIIYCKVVSGYRDKQADLSCVETDGKSNGLGCIEPDGFLFRFAIAYTRRLLSENCAILPFLGTEIAYEAIVGVNGRVWIKADSVHHVMAIYKVLAKFERRAFDPRLARQCLLDYLITHE